MWPRAFHGPSGLAAITELTKQWAANNYASHVLMTPLEVALRCVGVPDAPGSAAAIELWGVEIVRDKLYQTMREKLESKQPKDKRRKRRRSRTPVRQGDHGVGGAHPPPLPHDLVNLGVDTGAAQKVQPAAAAGHGPHNQGVLGVTGKLTSAPAANAPPVPEAFEFEGGDHERGGGNKLRAHHQRGRLIHHDPDSCPDDRVQCAALASVLCEEFLDPVSHWHKCQGCKDRMCSFCNMALGNEDGDFYCLGKGQCFRSSE